MSAMSSLSVKKILVVAGLIGYIISLWGEVCGLKCYECNPCNGDELGTLVTCNETAYENLPDKGYLGCSCEVAAADTRRKRCIWLRNDPDDQNPNKQMRCSPSPHDDDGIKKDCYCFTDGCNKKMMDMTTKPPGKGPETGQEPGSGSTNFRPTNIGVLSIISVLEIKFLQVIGRSL